MNLVIKQLSIDSQSISAETIMGFFGVEKTD